MFRFIPSISIIIDIMTKIILVLFVKISIITINMLTSIVTIDGNLCFVESFQCIFNPMWTSRSLFPSSAYDNKVPRLDLPRFFLMRIPERQGLYLQTKCNLRSSTEISKKSKTLEDVIMQNLERA